MSGFSRLKLSDIKVIGIPPLFNILIFYIFCYYFILSHSHYLLQNIHVPTDAAPRIVCSVPCIPSAISLNCFLLDILPICLLTDEAVPIPTNVYGLSPHVLPVSQLHSPDKSDGLVLGYALLSYLLLLVFCILVSIFV